MDSDEKKIDYGVLALAIVFGYICFILLIPLGSYSIHYSSFYGLFVALILLFIVFCLIAFFTIRPVKTQKGNTILGLTSMIFGVVIFFLPLIDVLILASHAVTPSQVLSIFISSISFIFVFLVAGVMLLWNGISMCKKDYTSRMLKKEALKKEARDMNEKKIDYGTVALAIIGCYISLYILITFSHDIPYSIGYGSFIALIFLFIVFCLIAFFTIRPTKTRKGKRILGLTSMVFGVAILIFPLIDVLISSSRILVIFLFLVAGALLLANGISMFRKNYTSRILKRDV